MINHIAKYLSLVLSILLIFSNISIALAAPQPFDIQAKSAILMEYETGTILYEKNADEKFPIASLTKIMTILLALESIDAGQLKLNDKVTVSEYASSMGGSQVFLHAGETLSVDALLKAIVVASGNDACVAIAEKISGSHEVFVSRMNQRAKELGMNNTNFVNCTGLPADNHYSTARDVAIMSCELLKHPAFFRWSSIWVDTLEESRNKTELANTNKLVRFYDGTDGIKTGYTQEAGHCLSATTKRGNMRLLSVVLNAPTSQVRFSEATKMMDYGFANFKVVSFLKKNQIIKPDIRVTGGKEEYINGIISSNVNFLIKSDESTEFVQDIEIDEKITAPLEKGEKIGTLTIRQDDRIIETLDIISDRDVFKGSCIIKFKKIFNEWIGK